MTATADTLIARGSSAKYTSHPEGQFVALCVDAINLGDKVEEFPGTPAKIVPKCALVFRTGEHNQETGEYIDVAQEFTVSMGEKANLRKTLEQWRGKPYTAAQVEEGVPLHKLTGQYALLTVSHKTSRNNRTYAIITACVGVPKQLAGHLPTFGEYTRADYWETRKREYADGVRTFKGQAAAAPAEDDDFPQALQDGDDDLPF